MAVHHKKGNAEADQFADLGVEEHGNKVTRLVTWLHARRRKYVGLMKHVHIMIVAVLKCEKEERMKR